MRGVAAFSVLLNAFLLWALALAAQWRVELQAEHRDAANRSAILVWDVDKRAKDLEHQLRGCDEAFIRLLNGIKGLDAQRQPVTMRQPCDCGRAGQ